MADTTTTDASLSDMSLADYRASRVSTETAEPEKPAAAEPEKQAKAETPASPGVEDAAEEKAEETTEQPKPAKKGGFQKTIERQKREIEELKAKLAGDPAAQKPDAKAEPAPELPTYEKAKPRIEDFESIEQFAEALTDWKLDKKDFEREQSERQAKARTEASEAVKLWNQRKAEAQKQHSDYDEVLAEADDVRLSPAHQRLFLESEHGPELAYALASDREALEKFAAMHPLAAARWLGKLEASLEPKAEDAPKPETKVSSAPKPVRSVGGRAGGSASLDLSKLSLADYRRARDAGKVR